VQKLRIFCLALLLIFAISSSRAAGKKVWSVNVARLGYRGDADRTIVRWRGSYVVIGSSKFTPDPEKHRCILAFDPKQPLLVFDVIARKQIAADVIGSLEEEWEPPHSRWKDPCGTKMESVPYPLTSDLYYDPDYEKNWLAILDQNHKEKYRISPGLFSCWSGCTTSNRAGDRYALLDKGRTLGTWIMDNTLYLGADAVDTDKKRIRVYSAKDGRKLYQVSWVETGHAHALFDQSERVAFSDNGSMLAILDDEGVLRVVGISDE